ncbi:MAG: hypothetical protein L3K17_06455 [Thermoplasmata archaeon]|nr:hypothetical protein [Thermoplasmata archaeon]
MSLPGPGLVQWGLELFALAGLLAATGEGVRRVAANHLPWFRFTEPFEWALLDLYLGGALLYVLAVIPVGLFRPVIIGGCVAAAAGWGVAGLVRHRGGAGPRGRISAFLASFRRPTYQLVLLATLVLFAVELAALDQVPTGNTFDSSVDATFTALLNLYGTAPSTLHSIAPGAVAYPQGATAIFAFTQLSAALPAARVPLLVTPLFLALGPLGGFAIGRRWMGSESAGAICALSLALVGPGTRYLAAGSNDFALAFPLVLLLSARAVEWVGPAPLSLRDALAFGGVAGYSAALNPVGAEWLFVLLPMAAAVAVPRFGSRPARWGVGWLLALAAGVVWVLPSLAALTTGARRSVPAGISGGGGITTAQFVGWSDPLLFGPGHVGFSPVLALQLELATLMVLGALLLIRQFGTGSLAASRFARWAGAGIVSGLLWLTLALLGGMGVGWAADLSEVSSAGQISLLLFTIFTLVGAYVLVWVWERGTSLPRGEDRRPRRRRAGENPPSIVALLVVGLVLLPGTAATVVLLPSENSSIYHDFSRVTSADFDFLAWAASHLPAGSRVLVAPGSAAEFLPAYDPQLAILFPMIGPSWTTNASYLAVRALLANGTLGMAGVSDLGVLGVQYIAVTGNDTILFPAFSTAPFLGNPASPLLYENAETYLFEWDG